MDLTSTKLLVAILFGVLRFFSGIFPIKIYSFLKLWEQEEDGAEFINEKRHRQVNCYLALFQSFGGGVLFATCFIHMIPEVYQSVQILKKYGEVTDDYPYSQLVVCIGFFLVYFIEELSHWFISTVPENSVACTSKKRNSSTQVILKDNKISPSDTEKIREVIMESPMSVRKIADELSLELEMEAVEMENMKNIEKNVVLLEAKELDQIIEKEGKTQQQILRCILIVLALSLHSIFEGLAIGLQSSILNIWYLFTAVSIHSATILFCIGLELVIAKTKTKTIIIHILTLSVMSPFGVLAGLLITLKSDMDTKAKSAAVILLEGLSAGTILYITFFEVLNREKERRVYRLKRGICIMAGFVLMTVLECVKLYN